MIIKKIARYLHIRHRHRFSTRWECWLWQNYCESAHEADIYLLSYLEGLQGQVLDVGANAAIFANSLFNVNTTLTVQSWEPNLAMRRYLLATKLLYPQRFNYHMRAAGNCRDVIELHIPVANGNDLSPSASLDPAEFEKNYVVDRLRSESVVDGQFSFVSQQAKVFPVDDFQLQPLVVKIDVEGWELQALEGMRETLQSCSPLLMIEMNNHERWWSWLQELGYRLFSYDHEHTTLTEINDRCPTLNVIGLHRNTPTPVWECLTPLFAEGTVNNSG